MTFEFITDQRGRYRGSQMCRVLNVSRSGYYAWRRRGPSQRATANESLLSRIRVVQAASGQTYGSPRVQAELHAQGVRCSLNRVARLMRLAHLRGRTRRRARPRTTQVDSGLPVAPNRLGQSFAAETVNQTWLSEIVCTQMTKTHVLGTRTGGNHIANLDVVIGHDDPIDEQFDQLTLLLESRRGEASLYPPTEIFRMSHKPGQLVVAIDLRQ